MTATALLERAQPETTAEYFYDYAGQDPINRYDLTGSFLPCAGGGNCMPGPSSPTGALTPNWTKLGEITLAVAVSTTLGATGAPWYVAFTVTGASSVITSKVLDHDSMLHSLENGAVAGAISGAMSKAMAGFIENQPTIQARVTASAASGVLEVTIDLTVESIGGGGGGHVEYE